MLLGKQGIDDDNNQTGQMLAALWNRPQATFASKLELRRRQGHGHARSRRGPGDDRSRPAGRHSPRDLRLNEPRYVKLPDIMKAKKKPLDTIADRDLGVGCGRAVQDAEVRTAGRAPERHHGEGRRRTGRGAQAEGVGVMSQDSHRCRTRGRQAQSRHRQVRDAARSRFRAPKSTSLCSRRMPAPSPPQAAALAGVKRVLKVDNAANAEPLAAVLAPQVAALAANYTHVFGPSTTFGKDLMPRVAALLGVGQFSDIMAVEVPLTFPPPHLCGQRNDHRRSAAGAESSSPRCAPHRSSPRSQAAARRSKPHSVSAEICRRIRASCRAPRRRRAGRICRPLRRVVSGGRALGSAENFKIIFSLADKLGAAVGASRAAVDAGYAANDLQVGQTGKIIAPELYVAIGISGAIQHLTGIKDARTIVAINKDAEAPIFEVADIGLVGDLFTILPELEKALG